ncbi:hypothetical protein ACN27F_33130 [Solwaraspora sp. WMMB335]
MRLRAMITTTAALLAATAAAVIVGLSQSQAVWDLAGYTWSN